MCKTEVGGVHTFKWCGKEVHFICGKPEEGDEEGYGQQVVCFNYLKETPKLSSPKNQETGPSWSSLKRSALNVPETKPIKKSKKSDSCPCVF